MAESMALKSSSLKYSENFFFYYYIVIQSQEKL